MALIPEVTGCPVTSFVASALKGQSQVPTDQGAISMRNVFSFLSDESGASAAEYALILVIIGAVLATAMTDLGTSIATALGNVGTYLETAVAP
jgi:pilus assembly protein Flp/PilA